MDHKDDYFDSTEFGELMQRYDKSLQNGNSDFFSSDELADIAEFCYNSGDKQKADNALEYAIRTFPGAALPLVLKARIALSERGDTDTARHYLSQIDNQLDLDCLYTKAEILIQEGDVEGADNLLRGSFDKIDDDDRPDYVLDVASLFVDYNCAQKAEWWLLKSDETDLEDYREIKARIAFAKGDYEESQGMFEELLDENPFSTRYWNSLASTQLMGNHFNESITSSEYSIAINPDNEQALYNKANALFSLNNYEEALKYYERYQRLCPDDGTGMLFIGNCHINMGHADDALLCYLKALNMMRKQKMSTTEVLQCLAYAYSRLNQPDKAIENVAEAMAQPDANKAELLVVRGHIYLDSGNTKAAIRDYLDAIDMAGKTPEIFIKVAVSTYDCGFPSVAYRLLRTAFILDDNNTDTYAVSPYLASCCLQLNHYYEYLYFLRFACEQFPLEAHRLFADRYPDRLDPKCYYKYEVSKTIDDA